MSQPPLTPLLSVLSKVNTEDVMKLEMIFVQSLHAARGFFLCCLILYYRDDVKSV